MKFVIILLALLFSILPQGPIMAAGCDNPTVPDVGAKSLWYCDNGSDTVVVFVHGLNSNSRSAWLWENPRDVNKFSFWPKILLEDDAFAIPEGSRNKPSVFLADYYTAIDSTIYGMNDAADLLFKALSERANGEPAVLDQKNVVFVAHSLGGVLVRDVLVHHAKDFAGKRVAILLVASPSQGSSYAEMLVPAQRLARNQLVAELQKNSNYLKDLDRDFKIAVAPDGQLSDLRGKEIYEHRILAGNAEPNADWFEQLKRAVLETLAETALRERVVEPSSATGYFPEPRLIPESNHVSIAHPTDLNHPSHLALRDLFRQMTAVRPRSCEPPADFKVILDMARHSSVPTSVDQVRSATYQLIQLDRLGEPLRNVSIEPDPISGFYKLPLSTAPFACLGEEFWAKLSRVATTSALVSAGPVLTDACFRRSRIRGDENKAFLHCQEGRSCEVDKDTPGLADACPNDRVGATLVRGGSEPSANTKVHWSVPSLETLDRKSDEARPGYAEFKIVSGQIARLSEATHLGYGVSVNGVPIFMDGFPPFLDRISFSGSGRVHLTFALENLGFTGGTDGYEQIEVEIRFYNKNKLVKTARIRRNYVSYRHAALLQVADANSGETYEWHGYYRPAKVQASYEVMLEHGGADWVRERRKQLDASGRIFEGSRVVGVIRPERIENPTYGLIIGLKLPSGQVRSLFSREEADSICRWILRAPGFGGLQRLSSYIFQFPPEIFTDQNDRGRRVAYCREVQDTL